MNTNSASNTTVTLDFDGPTALEQLFLELVNRARLDPAAEAARQGTTIGTGVSATPSQALAYHAVLHDVATAHSIEMLERNFFAHTNPFTNKSPFDRMLDAGYDYLTAGENVAWNGATYDVDDVVRVQALHDGLWNSLGHRVNLMSNDFSEAGIGLEEGAFTNDGEFTYNYTHMVTQNFGDTGKTYLTGVVIDDADGDEFYDVGEGQGGVQVRAVSSSGEFATATWDAGGYTLELSAGTYEVTFYGGDLDGIYSTEVTIGSQNVKLDVFESDASYLSDVELVFVPTQAPTLLADANEATEYYPLLATQADPLVSTSIIPSDTTEVLALLNLSWDEAGGA